MVHQIVPGSGPAIVEWGISVRESADSVTASVGGGLLLSSDPSLLTRARSASPAWSLAMHEQLSNSQSATVKPDGDAERVMTEELTPATGRDDRRSEQGATLAAISRRIVGLLKEYNGKGPTKARTFQSADLVVVVLSGGYTQAERTLIEEGRTKTVMDLRAEFQDVMGPRFKRVIHEEMRREVLAFMSAAHHDPDYNVEIFILAPHEGEHRGWVRAVLQRLGDVPTHVVNG